MIELVKGKAYNVRHHHSKQTVRRIYKGTEKRFGEILCYVFTGKVSKKVSVEIEPTGNPDVNFLHWRGCKHVPGEISIPFYNLTEVKEA